MTKIHDFLCEWAVKTLWFTGVTALVSGFIFMTVYFVVVVLYLLGIEAPLELPSILHTHKQGEIWD